MVTIKPVLLMILVLTGLSVAEDEHVKGDRSDFKKLLSKECAVTYTLTCFKLDVVSWVDKLNENDYYNVLPGVSVVREGSSERANTSDIVTEAAREFPNDPDARLDAFLMKKVTGYLNSHSLKLTLWNQNGEARGKGGGGYGGGKKGGGMEYLLAAGAMMKGTLMALALGGLAAIAGKALMTALISLLLSAIIGIKSLSHHGHKQTTYEIVAKPIYSHSNTHSTSHEDHGHYGHSSYGRSFDASLPLGLQPEYKPVPIMN